MVKCVFFFDISNFVSGKFLKNAPWRNYTLGPKNSSFGSFIKILKISLYRQSPWQQLCPRAYFSKMTPQQVKFERISGKIDKMFENQF